MDFSGDLALLHTGSREEQVDESVSHVLCHVVAHCQLCYIVLLALLLLTLLAWILCEQNLKLLLFFILRQVHLLDDLLSESETNCISLLSEPEVGEPGLDSVLQAIPQPGVRCLGAEPDFEEDSKELRIELTAQSLSLVDEAVQDLQLQLQKHFRRLWTQFLCLD